MKEIKWGKARSIFHIPDWTTSERTPWVALAICIIGAVILLPFTTRLPMLGFDWFYFFVRIDQFVLTDPYPPWTSLVLKPLTEAGRYGYPMVIGINMISVAVATVRASTSATQVSRLVAVGLALFSGPLLILLWEGSITGITLFGLIGLPFTLPIALLQPNLTLWAVLARRQWIIIAIIFGLLSLLIWGLWPINMLMTMGNRTGHPISMGWGSLGWPVIVIGLVMLPFTLRRADPLRWMANGAFLMPHVMPYHLLVLLPVIGRAEKRTRLMIWLVSWLTLLPPFFLEPWSKYAGLLFPLAVWWVTRPKQIPNLDAKVQGDLSGS